MKSRITKNGSHLIPLLYGRSNVFLIVSGNVTILVDTSISWFKKRLLRKLEQLKITKIDYLVLTHTHFDHAGNAHEIKKKYNPQVIVHETERINLESGTNRMPISLYRFLNFVLKKIETLFYKKAAYIPCQANIMFEDQYRFTESEVKGYLLYTPGHSLGSVSFILDDELAVVGDAMFGIFKKSIVPTFVEDIPEMIKSWEKLLDTDAQLFFPGHGRYKTKTQVETDYLKWLKKTN
jgi:hydroxyacylglutathione hydrolase